LPKVAITSFCTDRNNRIWFSTAGEGIYYWDEAHLYNINKTDGLTDDFVYTLALDSSGGLVAGTDRGLSFIAGDKEKKRISAFTAQKGLPDNIVRTIIAFRCAKVLVGRNAG
jgi:ligand-binding sensor domain-containing protein